MNNSYSTSTQPLTFSIFHFKQTLGDNQIGKINFANEVDSGQLAQKTGMPAGMNLHVYKPIHNNEHIFKTMNHIAAWVIHGAIHFDPPRPEKNEVKLQS